MKHLIIFMVLVWCVALSGCYKHLNAIAPDGTQINYTSFGNQEMDNIKIKTPAWSASVERSVQTIDESALVEGIVNGLKVVK